MDVKLPRLGEGSESGVVVGVLVKPGDFVSKGQTILELENEKAVAPIPSDAAGEVLLVKVQTGDRIQVGQTLLVLKAGQAVGVVAEAPLKAQTSVVVAGEGDAQSMRREVPALEAGLLRTEASGPVPPASPSVRKVADDLGIDLRLVTSRGAGGRVVMGDLRAYLQGLVALVAKGTAKIPESHPSASGPVPIAKNPPHSPS